MINELKQLHILYNEIGEIQRQLPNKKGKKDYSELERLIIDKAIELKSQCNKLLLRLNDNDKIEHSSEIGNILTGASRISINPYLKIGGHVKI